MVKMEQLSAVFHWTAKCHQLPAQQISTLDVVTALRPTCGEDSITGMILNRRSVEVSVNTKESFNLLISRPATLPNTTFQLKFEPCYSDTFNITFYNVPLCSTGARETAIIAAAGANVIQHTIRQFQTAAGSINTGERTFLCTGRSTFTYLPLVVESYEGRQLGIRYRGQARDLATLLRPEHSPSSALATGSHWADSHPTTFDDHINQVEMTTNADLQESGDAAKVPQASLPTTQPSNPSERIRKKSDAASDSERSRSPHKDRRPPCAHHCPVCASSFPSADTYTTHLRHAHPDDATTISEAWLGLKAKDATAYATLRLTATCDICLGVFPHRLPPDR